MVSAVLTKCVLKYLIVAATWINSDRITSLIYTLHCLHSFLLKTIKKNNKQTATTYAHKQEYNNKNYILSIEIELLYYSHRLSWAVAYISIEYPVQFKLEDITSGGTYPPNQSTILPSAPAVMAAVNLASTAGGGAQRRISSGPNARKF